MTAPPTISVRTRDFVNLQVIVFALIWFASPLLAYLFGNFSGGMLTFAGLWLFLRFGSAPPRHVAAEIELAPLAFREYQFRARIRLFVAIVIVQIIASSIANNLYLWVMTATILVIGGALLAHDRIEIGAMAKNQPNKALEPTITSVTDRAAHDPRQP